MYVSDAIYILLAKVQPWPKMRRPKNDKNIMRVVCVFTYHGGY